MHVVVINADLEAVNFLTFRNAIVATENLNGLSPIKEAFESIEEEGMEDIAPLILKVLIKAGISQGISDNSNQIKETILHQAVMINCKLVEKIFQILAEDFFAVNFKLLDSIQDFIKLENLNGKTAWSLIGDILNDDREVMISKDSIMNAMEDGAWLMGITIKEIENIQHNII